MNKDKDHSTYTAINMLEDLGRVIDRYKHLSTKQAASLLKEILSQPTPVISTDKEKSELVELLHHYLKNYRKIFPSKVAVARFAKEYELSSLSEKTLAQGVPFRIIFEAFDAQTENLERAVAYLKSQDTPIHRIKSSAQKGTRTKQKEKTPKSDWGNTIRELFNTEPED